MTKEQRVKLEKLISEYGNSEFNLGMDEYERGCTDTKEKAREKITDYLDLIQYNNALYNFQRFGVKDLEDLDLREWEKKGHLRK
jgi:hypothetical protein